MKFLPCCYRNRGTCSRFCLYHHAPVSWGELVNFVSQGLLRVTAFSKIIIFGNFWDSPFPSYWHVHSSPKQLLIWGRFVAFEWTLPLEFPLSAGSLQKQQGRWHRLAISTQIICSYKFCKLLLCEMQETFYDMRILFIYFFYEHDWLNMMLYFCF